MVVDPAYDDQNLYELSVVMGVQLVCPVVDTKQPNQKKDFYWWISISVRKTDMFTENTMKDIKLN